MKDSLFEIWFALQCKPACKEFQTVLAKFGSAYDVYNADPAELERLHCSLKLKQALADKSLAAAHSVQEYCKANGVGILFWTEEAYPATLRSMQDPPALLYYRGKLPSFGDRLCIGVVGTRSMSEYGKRMAYKIGYELAAAGTVVISGMALGVDAMSAAGAMAALILALSGYIAWDAYLDTGDIAYESSYIVETLIIVPGEVEYVEPENSEYHIVEKIVYQ